MEKLVNDSKNRLQEDELITCDNIMQISERIALKGLKKALSYSFNKKLYKLYIGLNTDITNKHKAEYVLSDGYDLVMTAAQFLCEHIGERLNAPCGTNTKNKLITLAKKESFLMANNNCPEVINITAPENMDIEEYEQQWQKVDETIEKMHLTQVQYETLSCYIAGMRFEEIVRMYGVVESTVWSRRQKVKTKYLKCIVNGQN